VLISFLLRTIDSGSLMNTTASLRGAKRPGAEYAELE
jgi:hypothetical protein